MIRVLVVDDEPLARERIRTLVEGEPGFEVAGECGDGLSALEAHADLKPDLLLLDIQMPGLGGLEVAEALGRDGPLPLVVFITAYDRYALAAFHHHALDYIQKPIDPARFHQSLERARALVAGQARLDQAGRVQAALQDLARVRPHTGMVVQERDRYIRIPLEDIHCLEATGNYVCLHCPGSTHFLRATLAGVEAGLDPERFRRTHRSWIVNVEQVVEARPVSKGAWTFLTRGGHEVPVSPPHRDVVQAFLAASSLTGPLSSHKV